MKRQIALLISITSLLTAAGPVVVTKDTASKFYRGFKRLTEKPHPVSPSSLVSCISVSPPDPNSPHRLFDNRANGVHLYANDDASRAIVAERNEFPEGSVIVKEKLTPDEVVTGIGGMIKRAKGYDPKNGDWEFFYFTPGGEFTTGKLANCIDCHSGGKRDHVFSVWSLGAK